MRKKWKILIGFSIIISLIIMLSFVISKRERVQCNAIDIVIVDSADNYFIEKNDVLQLVYQTSKHVIGYPIDSINAAELENKLNKHPYIKLAEIYKTIDGILKIELTQRQPIIRIFNRKNESYYIDNEGYIMPTSIKFTSHELIANGFIKNSFNFAKNKRYSIGDLENCNSILCDLYKLAKYIQQDDLLNAQIEQIYVTSNNEYELIPKVGEHIIQLGTIYNYEEKFDNLKIFYKKGFIKTGWKRYSKIVLKYKDQIVCKKR